MRPDQKEVMERVRLMKADILSDKNNATIFRSKIREVNEMIPLLKTEVYRLTKLYVEAPDNEKIVAEWWMDKAKQVLENYQRQQKAFQWMRKLCEGKIKATELNVEGAKQFPIGNLIPYGPSQRSQKRWMYCCPIHNETNASFVWYIEQNKWHCFACSIGGDSIDLLMKTQGLKFKDAVNQLNI